MDDAANFDVRKTHSGYTSIWRLRICYSG